MTSNSGPRGASVNDGIEKELCSLKYVLVDEAMREVIVLGQGTQLAKFDIESAYRLIPVHADDRPLLGMRREKTNIDLALPFGLRSAPKVFNAVADAMHWGEQHGVKPMLHYLDDFLVMGAPSTRECKQAFGNSVQETGDPHISAQDRGT